MRSKLPVVCVAVVAMTLGCGRLTDLRRFYLTRCPADGPVRETQFDLHLEPVDVDEFYARLRAAAADRSVEDIPLRADSARQRPILYIGPIGNAPTRRILVVAGVHGNEIAATLAAPALLDDVRANPAAYERCELHLLAPANPVGFEHQSRYNTEGCDINRDFGEFATVEARAVRQLFERVSPALLVALHEGPQDGFYVIGTRTVPEPLPPAVAEAVYAAGLPLASESFLGFQLSDPGYQHEGAFKTLLKDAIRLHSLGAYAEHHDTGVLTTETPWGSPDVAARVQAHVIAVRAACRTF